MSERNMEIPIEQRYGKRVYQPHEWREFGTIKKGDGFFLNCNKWVEHAGRIGGNIEASLCPSGRPIEVGDGYRLVGLNEKLTWGDEFDFGCKGGDWTEAHTAISAGYTVRQALENGYGGRVTAFRRKVAASPVKSSGDWVKIKSGCVSLPEPNRPLWILRDETPEYWHGGSKEVFDLESQGVRFWQYADNAAPLAPAPEKSEEELAFEKARSWAVQDCADECENVRGTNQIISERCNKRMRYLFDAGISFARKGE